MKTIAGMAKKSWKGTWLLFLTVVAGIFFFMLVAIIFGQSRGPLVPELNKYHTTLMIGMAAASFACLLLAKQVFTRGVALAKDSINTLTDKLNLHRTALVKYVIICEIPVMLSIVLFLLTGNFAFQIYAGVFIGFMLTMMPTRSKIAEQLQLTGQQQQELE
jgi:hypothetical protein